MFGNFADEVEENIERENEIEVNTNLIIPSFEKSKHFMTSLFEQRLLEYEAKNQAIEDASFNRTFVRVSNLSGGGCLRERYYDLLKEDLNHNIQSEHINPNMQNVLRTTLGNKLHDFIQELLENDLHGVEERVYDNEYKVTGKPDGLYKDSVFEIKTVGLSVFNEVVRKGIPKESHVKQVHWYMRMLGLKKAIIFYVNRNIDLFFGTVDSFSMWDNIAQQKVWRERNLEECIKTFEINFNEDIMDNEIRKVKDFWSRYEIAVENERISTKMFNGEDLLDGEKLSKEKPPPKISTDYICNTCKYLKHCRG